MLLLLSELEETDECHSAQSLQDSDIVLPLNVGFPWFSRLARHHQTCHTGHMPEETLTPKASRASGIVSISTG